MGALSVITAVSNVDPPELAPRTAAVPCPITMSAPVDDEGRGGHVASAQLRQAPPALTGKGQRGGEEVEGPDYPPGRWQAAVLRLINAPLVGLALEVCIGKG